MLKPISPITLLILAVGGAACGQYTPHYHIYVAGDSEDVALGDVDRAWTDAASLADVEPGALAQRLPLNVTFTAGPVQVSGDANLYHGMSVNEDEAVETVERLSGSVLDSNHVLVHEFYHTVLFLERGDADYNHVSSNWHVANQDWSAK